jgi:hypothetical protein
MAQNLTSLLQYKYRTKGYAVPYNICNVKHEKFKGALAITDVLGACDPDAIALQVDFAAQYPSSL